VLAKQRNINRLGCSSSQQDFDSIHSDVQLVTGLWKGRPALANENECKWRLKESAAQWK